MKLRTFNVDSLKELPAKLDSDDKFFAELEEDEKLSLVGAITALLKQRDEAVRLLAGVVHGLGAHPDVPAWSEAADFLARLDAEAKAKP